MNITRVANKSNLFPYPYNNKPVTPNNGRTSVGAIYQFVDSIIRKSNNGMQEFIDWNNVPPSSSQLRLQTRQTRQIPQNKSFNKKA